MTVKNIGNPYHTVWLGGGGNNQLGGGDINQSIYRVIVFKTSYFKKLFYRPLW
jgi:hypothetical protein